MRYATATTNKIQVKEVHHDVIGSPSQRWTPAAITPAPAGIGMPTKYFLPGRPGFEGCGFLVMLKRANRLAPAIRKRKLATAPSCSNFVRLSPCSCGHCRLAHIQASMAGATPIEFTSQYG